jgi:hypothetical protein
VSGALVDKILKGLMGGYLPQPVTCDVPECYQETSVNNLVGWSLSHGNVSTPQGAIVLPRTR